MKNIILKIRNAIWNSTEKRGSAPSSRHFVGIENRPKMFLRGVALTPFTMPGLRPSKATGNILLQTVSGLRPFGYGIKVFAWFAFLPVVFAITVFASCGKEKTTDHETPEAIPVSAAIELSDEQMALAGIELGQPQKRVLSEKINCTGTVEVPPQSLASVYSPVQGFVKKVNHLPGDYVRKGELLTTISHPDMVKLQREFLEVNSQLSFLEKNYQRKQTLAAGNAASQRSLEEAKAKWDLEKARHNGLKAELGMIGISTKKLEEGGEIQGAIGLVTPVSGYVSKVDVNLGKLVTPNNLLFQVVDNSHTHLELQVFAKDLNKIKKGQLIECNMPGSDEVYTAKVHLTGKMIDLESKTAMVHGHFEKEPTPLAPGTFMQATLFTKGKEVWTVPETALVRQGGEVFIFVKNKDGFEKMTVVTGMSGEGVVEIMGLDFSANKQVALAGAYYLNGSADEEQ